MTSVASQTNDTKPTETPSGVTELAVKQLLADFPEDLVGLAEVTDRLMLRVQHARTGISFGALHPSVEVELDGAADDLRTLLQIRRNMSALLRRARGES